ncbi:MAG: mechanosensitive ion channel [Rhodocyclaceae bacterium]|nr:mechanosensitive ion channel [Rhodocyclaceae bacterium]
MNTQFGHLLTELWNDFQQPDLLWQVVALLLCLGLAKLMERLVRSREAGEGRAREMGHRGLKRLAFPVTGLILVLVARAVLAQWHHVNLLNLAVPLLLSLAVIRVVFFVLRLAFNPSGALAGFEKVFALMAWGVVALHILGVLPSLIDAMESVAFTVGKQKLNLWLILQGLATVLTTLLVALWLGGLIEARLNAATGLDANLRVVFTRLAKALLIVVAVMIGLPMVGIDLTTLSVFGGALGVGLGFGLQKIAANYVSGFIILLDRSIRIGNVISVGQERGIVSRITTRYTVVRANTGIEAIIPNETLVGSTVLNETYTDPKVRIALPVQVAYGTDLEQAMAVLVAAASSHHRVLAEPAPRALVLAFADSGISMELGFWISDPEAGTGDVRSDVNLAIWRAFQAAGIEIPFPQREVRMIGV